MTKARAAHRSEVLAQLSFVRPSSRSELVARTGLSRATITRITRDLIRRRFLREVPGARRSVGRPSQGLEINADYGTVLGISFLPPLARATLMDFRGAPLEDYSEALDWSLGAAGVLAALRRLVQRVVKDPALKKRRLSGVGLALPGQFDKAAGVSRVYPRLADWKDVPLRRQLGGWAGVPAFLIGYAPSIALAELTTRSEPPHGLLAIEVTDNIAMGVVANGGLLEGASGNAGELGHITLERGGAGCYCGNTGCLELSSACRAVEEAARKLLKRGVRVPFEAVTELARGGHAGAAGLLKDAATSLGVGVASAVNLFNPEIVVLSGRFFDAGGLVLDPLRASVKARALAGSVKPLTIERSKLGDLAPALGAGIEALRGLLRTL